MAGLVHQLQKDILSSNKSVTELLRTAKVIAAKLDLNDISDWIDSELNGYNDSKLTPDYRIANGFHLRALNPYRGWIPCGYFEMKCPLVDGMPTVEHLLSTKGDLVRPLPADKRIPLESENGMDGFLNSLDQQIVISRQPFTRICEQVKQRLLDWTIDLGKRGIKGEDMSFDEKEKEAAHTQVFNIQNMTGVAGNIYNSTVTVYDYSSLHQTLKQCNVPQSERNELENLMDSLAKAKPAEKPTLLEKAKQWVVRNNEFLGASAKIVRKALGFGEHPSP